MSTSNTRLLTIALASLAMVGPFAIDTYLPSFFNIAQDFDISADAVQQTLSIYLFAYAVMALFHGTLSDSFGRRPVIFVALTVFMLGSVGAMLSPSFGWLMFSRAVQGMSAGAGVIVGQAIVRDRFSGAVAQKMMANIMMVFGLAPAIAPIVGGYISTHLSWRAVFAFLLLFTFFAMCMAWKVLPESLAKKDRHPLHLKTIFGNYVTALKNKQFLLGALAFGFMFSGLALYISSAANFIIKILHLHETSFAWLFFPLISGMVIGSAINSKYAHRIMPSKMILTGYGVMGVGMLMNVLYNSFFVADVPWAIMPVFLYSFGMSLAMPGLMLKTLAVLPEMKGLASSMLSFVQMFLFAFVSGVITPLLFDSALKLALGVAAGVSVSALLWFYGAERYAAKVVSAQSVS